MSEDQRNPSPGIEAPKWTVVARVLRPQGRRGEVLANILTDFPESFGERKRFFLLNNDPETRQPGLEILLDHSWPHKGNIVLKFAGVDSISDAEALGRPYVAIPHEERMPLEDGALYVAELIGMTVLDVSCGKTREIGTVTDVIPNGAGPDTLQIGKGTNAVLVPFAQAYLKKIDPRLRRIEMELPEGLLDMNSSSAVHPGRNEQQES